MLSRLYHHFLHFSAEENQPAQLLSAMLLVLTSLGFTMGIVFNLMSGNPILEDPFLLLITSLSACFAFAYVLNWRGYYRTAAFMTTVTCSLAIFIGSQIETDTSPNNITILHYLVLPVLLSGLLLSKNYIGLLVLLDVAGMLLLMWRSPQQTGDLIGILGFVVIISVTILLAVYQRDSTEKKRHAILRNSEVRFRAAMEGSFDSFMIVQPVYDDAHTITDFRYVEMNSSAEALIQRPKAELLGKGICEVFPFNRTLGFFDKYVQVFKSGETLEEEFELPPDVPSPGWYQHQIVPLTDGIAITIRNITERRAVAQQQLQFALEKQRHRLLRVMITKVSDEFRNPLAAINTSVFLLEKDQTPERQQHRVGVIKTQSARLEKLIEEMITLARVETDPSQPLAINEILLGAARRIDVLAKARSISVSLALSNEDLQVAASEETLYRVCVNLAENAVRFTPEGGTIAFRTALREGQVVIEIQDNGVGISPELLPRIFDRFYMLEELQSGGLGLAIVKNVVDAYGGRIEVESSIGQGSTFRIWLPQYRPAN